MTPPNVTVPTYNRGTTPLVNGDLRNWSTSTAAYLAKELSNIQRAIPSGWAWPVVDGEVGVKDLKYYYGDVRRYGAVGDGVTDGTIACQNATASIIAIGLGVVYFPAGNYLVSDQIADITSATVAVALRGDGIGQTTVTMASGFGTGTTLFGFTGTSGNRVANCELASLTIKGRSDNTSDGIAISADYTNGLRFRDLFVNGVRNTAVKHLHCWDGYLTRVRTYGCGADASGVTFDFAQSASDGNDNTNKVFLTDCTTERGYGVGMSIRHGSHFSFNSMKFHGRASGDSHADDNRELLLLEDCGPILMTTCAFGPITTGGITSSSGAIRATGTDAVKLTLHASSFNQIGSDDTYCIYFDAGNVNSKLSLDGCLFGDTRATNRYIYLGSGIGLNTARIGSVNTFASQDFEITDSSGVAFRNVEAIPSSTVPDAFQLSGASKFFSGTGAPGGGVGNNGDYYFRADGAAGAAIYVKAGGAWGAVA